ncbi:hypothetical protein VK90_24030 [Bacillus sp. LK2]|nr:hypothetical protein VK90_24030 [Bacillus sp. LK2]
MEEGKSKSPLSHLKVKLKPFILTFLICTILKMKLFKKWKGERDMSEKKLRKMLESMTVEEVSANGEGIKILIKKSNIPLYGKFLKDYELNGVLFKKEDLFYLLREDKDSYIVELEQQSLSVISLPKKLEEKVFIF